MPLWQDTREQAAFDFPAPDIPGQSNDAEGASGDLQCTHVVALKARRVRNNGLLVGMFLVRKRPGMCFLDLMQPDTVVCSQVFGVGRRALAGEVSAACE